MTEIYCKEIVIESSFKGKLFLEREQNIPNFLRILESWVLHYDKIPKSARYEGNASTTNPSTWSCYERALSALSAEPEKYDGLGLVIPEGSGLVFIDIDHCYDPEENEWSPLAQEFMSQLGGAGYWERSQSGSGLHCILKDATIPRSFKSEALGLEMYDRGRYCALTGDILAFVGEGGEIIDRPTINHVEAQRRLSELYEKYKPREYAQRDSNTPQISFLSYSDSQIVERCSQAPQSGDLFRELYAGNFSIYSHRNRDGSRNGGHSEADLRLCQLIAFWCDRDTSTIDRIFRSSGLYRAKWERVDYRSNTLIRACNACRESISEYAERKRYEEAIELEKYSL